MAAPVQARRAETSILSSRSSSSCADIDFAVLFLTAHLAEFTPGVSNQKHRYWDSPLGCVLCLLARGESMAVVTAWIWWRRDAALRTHGAGPLRRECRRTGFWSAALGEPCELA